MAEGAIPSQTPGMWIRGGAAGLWSEACKAALIACGIDPNDFGTYDERARAQKDARDDYRKRRIDELEKAGKKHPAPCKYPGSDGKRDCECFQTAEALEKEGAHKWILMNSQSGHMSQNCFYQAPGKRADPCSNIRPSKSADGSLNSGGYGYRDNDAFCMDHIGLRTGMEHYEICRREQQHRASLGDRPATMADMRRGVEGTASIVVEGTASRRGGDSGFGDIDPLSKQVQNKSAARTERGELVDSARQKLAADMSAGASSEAQAAAGQQGAEGKKPNSVSGAGPDDETKKAAVKCLADAWEQSIGEMQATAVTEHGSAQKIAAEERQKELDAYDNSRKKGQKKADTFDDLPADRKKAAESRAAKRIQDRQDTLAKQGAESAGKANNPPTEQDCLEYQANWLYQHQKPDGTYPPMQGAVGAGPPPTTHPAGTVDTAEMGM